MTRHPVNIHLHPRGASRSFPLASCGALSCVSPSLIAFTHCMPPSVRVASSECRVTENVHLHPREPRPSLSPVAVTEPPRANAHPHSRYVRLRHRRVVTMPCHGKCPPPSS